MNAIGSPGLGLPVASAAPVYESSSVGSRRAAAAPLPPVALAAPRFGAAPERVVLRTFEQLDGELAYALASGDPATMMFALAARVRDGALDTAHTATAVYSENQHTELREQIRAFQEAKQAQANAAQMNNLARIGAYVGAALAIVVGVVGAVYSAGTSVVAAVGVAATLISAAATLTVMVVQDVDPHHTPPPRWLMISIAVVAMIGAACSAGTGAANAVAMTGAAVGATAQGVEIASQVAVECKWVDEPPPAFHVACALVSLAGSVAGAAGGGASSAEELSGVAQSTQRVAEGVRAAAEGLRGAVTAAQGGASIVAAVDTRTADLATVEAGRHREARKRNEDHEGEVLESMRAVMQAFRRAAERAMETAAQIRDARRATLGNFVRA